MDSDFRYTLIVSQFYHSYHMFIVKFDAATFFAKAKAFIADLESYKRYSDEKREFYYGDIGYEFKTPGMRHRYNVNDQGDIYFINFSSVNQCMHAVSDFHDEKTKASRGYKRSLVSDRIYEHHHPARVRQIIEKHFEMV